MEDRQKFIRKQAVDTLELIKGFTPEQRTNFSNELKTAEELAGYILELTAEDKAGPAWIKASGGNYDTFPVANKDVFIKYDKYGEQMEVGDMQRIIELLEDGVLDVRWLDESGEWAFLDEAAPSGEREIDIDELWDEHSEHIDDDIDSLSRWAGSTVVDKEQFRTLVAKLYELFKQNQK